MWRLLGALGALLTPVTTLWRAVAGDRAAKDAQVHAEQMSAYQAYAMEWAAAAARRTWWDALVDGLNRLIRPAMTAGIIFVVFVAPWWDPNGFISYTTALGLVPQPLWDLMWTVTAFWFGSRVVEKLQGRAPTPPSLDKAARTAYLVNKLARRGKASDNWAVRELSKLVKGG